MTTPKAPRSYAVFAGICALALAACGDPVKELSQAQPATGADLEKLSREIRHEAQIGKVAGLVQRFCKNMSSAPCPPDTAERLKPYGFSDGKTGIDLAHAFIKMAGDAKDGVADKDSSDADFIVAAYRVAFGREPDPGGFEHYSQFLKMGGPTQRAEMIVILLQSHEFTALK